MLFSAGTILLTFCKLKSSFSAAVVHDSNFEWIFTACNFGSSQDKIWHSDKNNKRKQLYCNMTFFDLNGVTLYDEKGIIYIYD